MHILAVGVLFLMVGSSLGQSGDFTDTPDDEDPEQEMRTSLNLSCFSKIRIYKSKLICIVSEGPVRNRDSIYYQICIQDVCEKKKQNEILKINEGFEHHNVCVIAGTHRDCRNYDVKKIAIPDPPSLSIHYNNATEDYVFDIKAPYEGNEYLKDKLIHEAVLRKRDMDWPVCENQIISRGADKLCFRNDYIRVSKRNVEHSTKYAARVRSKPNGEYFDGFWSHWSETFYFQTNDDENNEDDELLIVIFCCSALVVIFILVIVLTKLFWKDRIKPVIWPEVPDHKNALEKLCISPTKYIQISFNPDFFDNYHINKVDYMKAHVRTEDNFQVTMTDTQLEKKFDSTGCTNISSLVVGSKECSTLMSHAEQCSEPSDHMIANGTHEITLREKPTNPENVLLPSSGSSSTCIIPNDCPVTPGPGTENLPAYSCAVKQPNNGLRGICWEDISMYIAMSAFKTPNSTIKQSHNI